MAESLIPVKFVEKYMGYNAGETAGFGAEKAKKLIDGKFAVPFTERAVVTKGGAPPPPPPEPISEEEATPPKPPKPRWRRGR